MEKVAFWDINNKIENKVLEILVTLYETILNLHRLYNKGIVHIDFNRVNYLFNADGNLNKELLNSNHKFWTPQNPFPINITTNDEEVIDIWNKSIPATKNLIFTQTKQTIQDLIKFKNENHVKTVLIIGNHDRSKEINNKMHTVNVFECYIFYHDKKSVKLSVDTNDLKPNDLKPNDLKPNDLKPNDLKPNDLKPNDLKPNDLKSNDLKM